MITHHLLVFITIQKHPCKSLQGVWVNLIYTGEFPKNDGQNSAQGNFNDKYITFLKEQPPH